MKKIRPIFLVIFFASAVQIFAQLEGNPENLCRNGFFPRESENYQIAKIKGKRGERIYFYGDENDCPNGKNCRQKSHLIPNDEIIVSRTYGKFACSWFQQKKKSETVGWIEINSLEFVEANQDFEEKNWLGEWSYYENSIEINKSRRDGFYKITGNAFWKGLGDNVHIGELEDEIKPQGNVIKIGENSADEYDCKVTMRLAGKYLIVSDNMNCGGANVTFSGVYMKK